MEKRYHDLIVSLIKENRKYPGYEAILEDIVEDVYAHSRVVIESVTNEDVVTAYLNKVISTSIITVPKKLNFRHRVKRVSPVVPQPSTIVKGTVAVVEPEPVIKNEITEEPAVASESETLSLEINDELQITNEIENSPVVEETKDSCSHTEGDLDFETETVTLDAAPTVEPQALTFEDEVAPGVEESPQEPEELASVDEKEETWEMVSEPLNIIVEEPEVPETLDLTESFSEPEVESAQEIADVAAAVEDVFTPETAVEPSLDKSLVDKMINSVTDTIEPVEQPEPVFENEVVEESVSEVNEPLPMLVGEEISSDDSLILEESDSAEDLILQEEVLVEETSDILEESEEEETLSLDLSYSLENTVLAETNEDTEELSLETESNEPVVLSESVSDNKVEDFSMPSFKCFDYEPEIEEFDAKEICSELKDMDAKHPERKVLQVCDLKYSKKMSVPDIAAELGLNQEDVIETLYEIIDVVKD